MPGFFLCALNGWSVPSIGRQFQAIPLRPLRLTLNNRWSAAFNNSSSTGIELPACTQWSVQVTPKLAVQGSCWPLKAVGLLAMARSEEHTSELQSRENLVCR